MAGDYDRQRILRADGADGAGRSRVPRLNGDLRIRARLPVRDAGDGRQDILAKLGAFYQGLDVEIPDGTGKVAFNLVCSIRYCRRRLLFHRRQIHAGEVDARYPPLAILRDADPSNQRQVREYPGSAHEVLDWLGGYL